MTGTLIAIAIIERYISIWNTHVEEICRYDLYKNALKWSSDQFDPI